ncbi:MAG: AAA family ATPase [Planctomycetota bacterium]
MAHGQRVLGRGPAGRGRLDDARQLLAAIVRANHDAAAPFPEFLHADAGVPARSAPAPGRCRAALVEAALGGRRLLGTVRPPEPAAALLDALLSGLRPALAQERVVVTVAGETGSGKTTLAAALAARLSAGGKRVRTLHQDDYYHLPPAENARRRREDPAWRGTQEVDLPRLEADLAAFQQSGEGDVLLIEGTFVTLLAGADARVFLAATYRDTEEARRRRGREPLDAHLAEVLAAEHALVREHRGRADWVIEADGSLVRGGGS